jgi:predicted ATP-dependent serine protease
LKDPAFGFDKGATVTNLKAVMLAGQPSVGKSAVMKNAPDEFIKQGAVVMIWGSSL